MTKIISVIQNKGGVGKTTTTQNLGYLFSKLGKTLLIDLDSQANLSQSFDCINDIDISIFLDTGLGIQEISETLDLIPNSRNFDYWKRKSHTIRNVIYKLKNSLKSIKEKYDYILIDCPPGLDICLDLAVYSSNYALIISDGHGFSLSGFDNILSEIESLKIDDVTKDIKDLEVLGLVFTRYKKSNVVDQIIETTRQSHNVFNTVIRENIDVVESQVLKKSVIEYNPNCNASKDYQELFKEVLKKING